MDARDTPVTFLDQLRDTPGFETLLCRGQKLAGRRVGETPASGSSGDPGRGRLVTTMRWSGRSGTSPLACRKPR